MAFGRKCAWHVHRENVPIEVHHIWPLGYRGPDVPSNRIGGCANGHGMVHYLMEAMLKAEARGQKVTWATRRRYGWRVRRTASHGVRRILAQSMVP